jgi:hypothetical protein
LTPPALCYDQRMTSPMTKIIPPALPARAMATGASMGQ